MINILSHFHSKIDILANKWIWLCSCCLKDVMVPCMHVQGTYVLKITRFIHPYTFRHLRNEVMEHKKREMKFLNSNQ
jgi:hypothetical protein